MALIECPECGWEVSDTAAACPKCAYRLGAGPAPLQSPRGVSGSPKHQWWKAALSAFGRLALGTALAGVGLGEEDSVMAVIGGTLIALSAFPTWYRARMERLTAGQAASTLDHRVEDRISEIEHRHREQMGQLGQMHTAQIADLEERIEFTERMLSKQREQIGPG